MVPYKCTMYISNSHTCSSHVWAAAGQTLPQKWMKVIFVRISQLCVSWQTNMIYSSHRDGRWTIDSELVCSHHHPLDSHRSVSWQVAFCLFCLFYLAPLQNISVCIVQQNEQLENPNHMTSADISVPRCNTHCDHFWFHVHRTLSEEHHVYICSSKQGGLGKCCLCHRSRNKHAQFR